MAKELQLASDFRSLMLDLVAAGQMVSIQYMDGCVAHGRLVKVGDDYVVIEVVSMSTGGVTAMPAVPISQIMCINLRPVFADHEMPGDESMEAVGTT